MGFISEIYLLLCLIAYDHLLWKMQQPAEPVLVFELQYMQKCTRDLPVDFPKFPGQAGCLWANPRSQFSSSP